MIYLLLEQLLTQQMLQQKAYVDAQISGEAEATNLNRQNTVVRRDNTGSFCLHKW